MDLEKKFRDEAGTIAFDKTHRQKIKFNIGKYDAAVEKGKKQYINLELAKQRAANIKFKTIENIDNYLIEFEQNFEKNGGKVIWANDATDAVNEISKILSSREIKVIVKSKSMITEELELNPALEKIGISSVETDLGEYIVQVAGEKPYHIVTPAMHKSKEDVVELFNKEFDISLESTPEDVTKFVRDKLREDFVKAGAGITGANFLVADTGSVGLTENEGNGLMSISFPKVHIVIAGIERIIPSMIDLDLFWPLLATHGTGQNMTVYNSLISGPAKSGELDGPEQMFVILLNNGRTNLLKLPEQRRALSCIKCGACLNVCPVYRNIGGYTYNTVYSGPIGAVIMPHLKDLKDYKHLSFASSLCGACTEICPVNINLHELLLKNRRDAVKAGHATRMEKIAQYGAKKAMQKRWMMDFGNGSFKNMMMKSFVKKAWGTHRELPKMAQKSFRELWLEKRNGSK